MTVTENEDGTFNLLIGAGPFEEPLADVDLTKAELQHLIEECEAALRRQFSRRKI